MNFPDHSIKGPRSFVSQSTIDEQRKKRQEEWERTRKPDDPLEAPEEVYDPRTLYERLQEQKMQKEAEFEEKNKLQNFIPMLDSDDAQYIQDVDKKREELELIKLAEEEKALAEYKLALSHMTSDEQEKRISEFKSLISSNKSGLEKRVSSSLSKRTSQAALLSGIVKKESNSYSDAGKTLKGEKRKIDGNDKGNSTDIAKKQETSKSDSASTTGTGTIRCLGILPGIGVYGSDSSDSEASSLSDQDDFHTSDFSLVPKICSASTTKHDDGKK